MSIVYNFDNTTAKNWLKLLEKNPYYHDAKININKSNGETLEIIIGDEHAKNWVELLSKEKCLFTVKMTELHHPVSYGFGLLPLVGGDSYDINDKQVDATESALSSFLYKSVLNIVLSYIELPERIRRISTEIDEIVEYRESHEPYDFYTDDLFFNDNVSFHDVVCAILSMKNLRIPEAYISWSAEIIYLLIDDRFGFTITKKRLITEIRVNCNFNVGYYFHTREEEMEEESKSIVELNHHFLEWKKKFVESNGETWDAPILETKVPIPSLKVV